MNTNNHKPHHQVLDVGFNNQSATLFKEPITHLPKSLDISPKALLVHLEQFTGPMDLLLYLIKKHRLAISEISVRKVTSQYLAYARQIQSQTRDELEGMELVAEYLLMASILTEIKSRSLLPEANKENEEEMEVHLIEHLRQYAIIKEASERLSQLKQQGKDFDPVYARFTTPEKDTTNMVIPEGVDVNALTEAMEALEKRVGNRANYLLDFEPISLNDIVKKAFEKISTRLSKGLKTQFINFREVCDLNPEQPARLQVCFYFLAILELYKMGKIDIEQSQQNPQNQNRELYISLKKTN